MYSERRGHASRSRSRGNRVSRDRRPIRETRDGRRRSRSTRRSRSRRRSKSRSKSRRRIRSRHSRRSRSREDGSPQRRGVQEPEVYFFPRPSDSVSEAHDSRRMSDRRMSDGHSSAAVAVRAELARRWGDISSSRVLDPTGRSLQQNIQTRATTMQRKALGRILGQRLQASSAASDATAAMAVIQTSSSATPSSSSTSVPALTGCSPPVIANEVLPTDASQSAAPAEPTAGGADAVGNFSSDCSSSSAPGRVAAAALAPGAHAQVDAAELAVTTSLHVVEVRIPPEPQASASISGPSTSSVAGRSPTDGDGDFHRAHPPGVGANLGAIGANDWSRSSTAVPIRPNVMRSPAAMIRPSAPPTAMIRPSAAPPTAMIRPPAAMRPGWASSMPFLVPPSMGLQACSKATACPPWRTSGGPGTAGLSKAGATPIAAGASLAAILGAVAGPGSVTAGRWSRGLTSKRPTKAGSKRSL
ncbi:unnamed protein product [Polarella glacialis]|uniref:Uncharacterized protein n=1 Tax=Polarella glacialis TaxID=89957 RepID=A0A813DI47_POLGL|nr:unnamed protein product [Polarella glacialis]